MICERICTSVARELTVQVTTVGLPESSTDLPSNYALGCVFTRLNLMNLHHRLSGMERVLNKNRRVRGPVN